jgi:hypothetical protein
MALRHPYSLISGRFLSVLAVSLLFSSEAIVPASAGGPFRVTAEGKPVRWDASRPVAYRVDAGPLGNRSHAEAVAMVRQGFRIWEEVPTATLRFQFAGELQEDIQGGNALTFLNNLRAGDAGVVLFDSDGSIIEALRGRGASDQIAGMTKLLWDEQTGLMTTAVTVLNGRDGALLSDEAALRDCAHELGHFVGLDHSQLNEEQLYDGDPTNDHLAPLMSYFRGPNGGSLLHRDDIAWYSRLYPSSEFLATTGKIQGRVLLPEGTYGLKGVNVIARRVEDPQVTAVSVASGYLYRGDEGGTSDLSQRGEFFLPGLPPGTYTLEIRELSRFPELRVPRAFLPDGGKYWRQGSSAQDPPEEFTPLTIRPGESINGITIVTNGDDYGEAKRITEQEPNQLIAPQEVTLSTVITGSVEDGPATAESLPLRRFDALHDVFATTLAATTHVTVILAPPPGADLDLYVLRQLGSDWALEGAVTDPAAPAPPGNIDLTLTPGRYLFGVHRAGTKGSAYQLHLLGAPPAPSVTQEFTAITLLTVGDVTSAGARVRWWTASDVPSVLYYNAPQREVGSTVRRHEHVMSLSDLSPASATPLTVLAGAGRSTDRVILPLLAAGAAPAGRTPRILPQARVAWQQEGLAEVAVLLPNTGDGVALQVRLDQVTPSAGWKYLSERVGGSVPPQPLDLGTIGPQGAGVLVIRLVRETGSLPPALSVSGSYRGEQGRVQAFRSEP